MFIAFYINLTYVLTFQAALVKAFNLTRLRRQVQVYTMLRIVTNLYNNVIGMKFVPGLKLILGMMLAQSVFVCVRLSGKIGILLTVVGLSQGIFQAMMLLGFVEFTATVHKSSKKFINLLKQRKQYGSLEKTKMIEAIPIIAVTNAGMYKIKRCTCLTMFGILSNFCASVLIAFTAA